MSDDTPTPDEALPPAPSEPAPQPEPAPVAGDAAEPTETEIPAAGAPIPPPPAATARAVPSGHVAVPKWLLVALAALVGAALMFGVGYAVGDGTNDDHGAGGAPYGNDMPRGPSGNNLPRHPFGNPDDQGGRQTPGAPGSLGDNSQGGSGTQSRPATSGAFLGVATQQTAGGVEVTQVVSGSAASDAGLEVGDIITEFDGNAVTTPAQLANAVRNADPGDSVRVTYERNGQSRTVDVTLGSRANS